MTILRVANNVFHSFVGGYFIHEIEHVTFEAVATRNSRSNLVDESTRFFLLPPSLPLLSLSLYYSHFIMDSDLIKLVNKLQDTFANLGEQHYGLAPVSV